MVHGEVMVIRKLVVAGIVTAERSYLDCLLVMKEVNFSFLNISISHLHLSVLSLSLSLRSITASLC